MNRVYKTALVPYTSRQMFELVNDVDAYREFLPWCSNSRLLSREDDELCGEIEISRMGMRKSFSTCNKLTEFSRIEIGLHQGPFKRLQGAWIFTALNEQACKVELNLEFEFAGALIDKAFGTLFSQVVESLVDAFCKRATKLYGK